MGLNETVSAERITIGFFGMRNAGKSSLINAVTSQNLSVVSNVAGTTTDPVKKAMEILPLGPVLLIDTAGIDDEGELGRLRVEKTREVLRQTDLAVLVADATIGISEDDKKILKELEIKNIPHIICYNKCDLLQEEKRAALNSTFDGNSILTSTLTCEGIHELKEMMARLAKEPHMGRVPVGDLLRPGDVAVLVTPIDSSAPKGRMILPQQMIIRDVLDSGAINLVTKETELETALSMLKEPPRIVITDSQAFKFVSQVVPEDVALTSFSILMARYKGTLKGQVEGAAYIDKLKDGDTVLISEGCTHHRQCEDIGTVKMPKWLENYTGKKLNFKFTSGGQFPENLDDVNLIVHCGGCMLREKEMAYRMRSAVDNGVPMTNYGVTIAKVTGILDRSLEPLF